MENINVNFEIIGVNAERGVAYVKYWADGATVERFHADIGPYEVRIKPEHANLNMEEISQYIARIGIPIVTRQKDAMEAEVNGALGAFSNLLNQQSNTVVSLS